MKYDIQQRVFLVKNDYDLKNISLVQRAFRSQFPKISTPSHSVRKNIISNFEKYGSVAHVPPISKNPSPKREKAKTDLQTMISEFPKLPIRKAVSAIDVSQTLVYHIIHDDLHLKPYKFHLWHKLEDTDYQKRMDFAEWFLNLNPQTKK